MLKEFTDNKTYTEKEINMLYPNSMYILKDIKDINNIRGILMAVSTSRDSYKDICIIRKKLSDAGEDCVLLGSYNGGSMGILNSRSSEHTISIQYTLISPQKMTKDSIKRQYGSVSYAYTDREGDYYTIVVVSDLEAPILRSELLIDKVPFLGVEETEDRIVAEVV